jgi:hypothetical protein
VAFISTSQTDVQILGVVNISVFAGAGDTCSGWTAGKRTAAGPFVDGHPRSGGRCYSWRWSRLGYGRRSDILRFTTCG